MMNKFRNFIGYLGFFCLAIFVAFYFLWIDFLSTPIPMANYGFLYNLKSGATSKTVIKDLTEAGLIKHPFLFKLLLISRGASGKLKAGEYIFANNSTPAKIVDQLVSNSGLFYREFTIIPGSTFRQLRADLNRNKELKHLTPALSDAEIMQRLGHPELKPEGEFYPDTYFFAVNEDDLNILRRAFSTMQIKLGIAWKNRSLKVPYLTSYEALIAASIVEKETGLNQERPIIAGVLANRLRRSILLQFDPTVIYGLGRNFNGIIYRSDLLRDNPYNTYKRKGLPPTPISMPGQASIEAVMNPDENNYLYFVARGDGASHQFSRTLAEHLAAVAAAKKYHPWHINNTLIKGHLLKIFGN